MNIKGGNRKDKKDMFFKIVLDRSNENKKALDILVGEQCYALVGSIIRMELDSLIRVYYFNNSKPERQEEMLKKFFDGDRWAPTDRRMIENMPHSLGWARHIYDFCCAFIHLSPYHDWATSSDIPNLTREKRKSIVSEIREQQNDVWGYDTSLVIEENFGFEDLILFAPHIFKKLKANLECEINNEL